MSDGEFAAVEEQVASWGPVVAQRLAAEVRRLRRTGQRPEPIDARDLADGRPCWRCRRPVLTIVVEAGTGRAHETCERGHRQ